MRTRIKKKKNETTEKNDSICYIYKNVCLCVILFDVIRCMRCVEYLFYSSDSVQESCNYNFIFGHYIGMNDDISYFG